MNNLYFGDNLEIISEHIADNSIDLIYLDPPFFSNIQYNAIWGDEALFRSPSAELNLKREEYSCEKGHWWLNIE